MSADDLEIPEFLTEMLDSDAEVAHELITMFLSDMTISLNTLEKAINDAQPDQLARISHRVKGSCGQMGATGLAETFADFEKTALAGDLVACGNQMPSVRARFALIETRMTALLPACGGA